VAGKLGPLGPGAGCDGPVAKIARDLRVGGLGPNAVTLVDFKAGFEDAARGAVTTVDLVLVVVDPTTAAIQMARHMAGMVAEIRRGVAPATRHLERPELVEMAERLFREARIRRVSSVLNRIGSPATEGYVRAALEGGGTPVLAVFPDDPRIADQWLRGRRLQAAGAAESARALVHALEEAAREGNARLPAAGVGA
jgi:CO dehydrogenase nickel-insertion accessory protein CooC1